MRILFLFRLTFSVVSGCPQWNHFSGEMIVWNAVCFCGIREMMHTWVMTGRSKTIKASGRHVTGNDANSNGSLVKVLTRDETSARVRGEIKSVWTNGYQKYNTMKLFFEIFIFTLFIGIFRFFPYITLVNFWFQASGHSFSPRIVIFGLSEPCTIENWRLLKFFENSIFYG